MVYALLQILDNPQQDVPLIAVLRSPLFGFTPDDLALIRGRHSAGDFYEALEASDDPRSRDFLERLAALRSRARDMSVHRLIWRLYNELNVLGVFGAMAGGEVRRENLIALAEHARAFESAGYKGLFAFVSHLRFLLENGEQPTVTSGAAAGVQIMSIHRSKGLEFPHCHSGGPEQALQPHGPPDPGAGPPQAGIGATVHRPGPAHPLPHCRPGGGVRPPEPGDAVRGDAAAVRGHDPGPGEADPGGLPGLGGEKAGGLERPQRPACTPGDGGRMPGPWRSGCCCPCCGGGRRSASALWRGRRQGTSPPPGTVPGRSPAATAWTTPSPRRQGRGRR